MTSETKIAFETKKSFIKYFVFAFAFIMSFALIKTKPVEILGLGLFFAVNLLFFVLIGKELIDGTVESSGKDTEWQMRYGTLLISMVFSAVSSIMMVMTLVTLQNKFADAHTEIKWSETDRSNLDDAETIFITITTFIGVALLYVYKTSDDIRKTTLYIFDQILNGSEGNWVRLIFPIVIIAVGSALYGQLNASEIEVNKTPKRIVCDPVNEPGIQQFKDSFIKTYWFLFAFVVVVLARPFVEANFNVFGISPSMPLGFPPGDRSYIFGQNPSISLISLLTLGFSNLMGVNKMLRRKLEELPAEVTNGSDVGSIKGIFAVLVAFILATMVIYSDSSLYIIIGVLVVVLLATVGSYFLPENVTKNGPGRAFMIAVRSILLMPILRWDVMYLMAKYAFGLTGLIYAGFTIRDFRGIQKENPCMYGGAHIRQLYIAFIVFLVIFYAFNTLSASNITWIITNVMRFLVPPTLLGLSSYLVFLTNSFVQLAPKLVVQ